MSLSEHPDEIAAKVEREQKHKAKAEPPEPP